MTVMAALKKAKGKKTIQSSSLGMYQQTADSLCFWMLSRGASKAARQREFDKINNATDWEVE